MDTVKKYANKGDNQMSQQYSLFIGRWQNFHAGHEWLFNQRLDLGKNIWVAIRDVAPDEKNPKTAKQVLKELQENPFFIVNRGRVLLSIIPDIESFNYGRGVGYEIIEHIPPEDIKAISATKIRAGEIDREGQAIK
jgi:phosphopantetheine adenylyltransferase